MLVKLPVTRSALERRNLWLIRSPFVFGGERFPLLCDFEKFRPCVRDAHALSQIAAFIRVSPVFNGFVHDAPLTIPSQNINRVAVIGGLIGEDESSSYNYLVPERSRSGPLSH